ncbi:MAG: hypothetical protein E7645_01650 [Ruminococcaceae bacterium]|nr:hypothetical protein [Oscillospiraceae bacterium]
MAITKEMLEKLRNYNFSFGEYEKYTDGPGNVYYYEGMAHTIGGAWDGSPLSKADRKIIEEGIWLPSTEDLMIWLQKEKVSITISYDAKQGCFCGECVTETNEHFDDVGSNMQTCLYNLVFKVARYYYYYNNAKKFQ